MQGDRRYAATISSCAYRGTFALVASSAALCCSTSCVMFSGYDSIY